MSDTFSGDVLPSTTGQNLGTASQRWNVNGQTVDLTGNLTTTGNITGGSASAVTGASVVLKGASSGTTTVQATGVASGTITVPAATDTLVGKATTDVLTNKTLDTAGAGNVLKINGTQVSGVTGTGNAVLATSPTITAPVIASIVNTGTLTLPTSSDTLVGRATTDSLTNKSFDSTSNCVSKIASTTLGAPAISITFSAIPAGYKNLRLVVQARSDRAGATTDVIQMIFNGDNSAAHYDAELVSGTNVTAAAANGSGSSTIAICSVPAATVTRANIAGVCTVCIPNYAGTTFEKSVSAVGGFSDSTAANCVVEARTGSWRSTAAITSINLTLATGPNFVTGTTATLYGEP